MGVIFIKHHMTQLWQKRVHVYRPKMRCHTVNVWCIVVNNVLVFISQFSNCIRITQTHVLQFAFMFLTSYHAVQFMSYKHHKMFFVHFVLVFHPLHQICKIYIIKELVIMETYIYEFHTSF